VEKNTKPLYHKEIAQNSVVLNVKNDIIDEIKVIENVNVETLEILDTTILPVYDLTIKGKHEFFANNILVHNCSDSLRCCAFVIMQIIERGLFLKFKKREPIKPIRYR
jgi:hypothetical protein